MRLPRLARDYGESAAGRFEQRTDAGEGLFFAGGDDPKTACFGDGGAAEDRRSDVVLAALLMGRGDATGEPDTDGGESDVDGVCRERVYKSGLSKSGLRASIFCVSEDHGFGGVVVGEHGEDDVCIGDGFLRRCGDAGIAGGDGFRFPGAAVPECDVMTVAEEQAGDGRSHLAEAEEGDVRLAGHRDSVFFCWMKCSEQGNRLPRARQPGRCGFFQRCGPGGLLTPLGLAGGGGCGGGAGCAGASGAGAGAGVWPGAAWLGMPMDGPETTSSTRRFCLRPAAVLLSATGSANAIANRAHVLRGNALGEKGEEGLHGVGALLGELLVVLLAAGVVGVALDLNLQVGMGEEDAGNRVSASCVSCLRS